MRSRIRSLFATVVTASCVLLAVACSDDGAPVAPTYPTPGDGGTGSSTSSTSSGGSSGSVTPDSGGSVDAGLSCAPLPAQADVRSVQSQPSPTGGTIMDGTYELTSATEPDDAADGGVLGRKAATLVFSGNRVAWNFDSEMVGQTGPRCCIGTWSIENGVIIRMTVECMASEGSGSYPSGYDVIDEGGVPQFRLHLGLGVETFTKR